MSAVISVENLSKTYASGFCALKRVNLEIRRGEIFALLGPNGAGKTTLIGIICGLVNATSGKVTIAGNDLIARLSRGAVADRPRAAGARDRRIRNGLERPSRSAAACSASASDPAYLEKVLRDLSLWDKKDNMLRTLSGGMKRRVMIAKALSHEPQILFLDEPTAGVDVELRKEMWEVVRSLRDSGVTIILTTHYIEEAELMADRIGVINKGELILVEEKAELMRKLGKKRLVLHLQRRLDAVPASLDRPWLDAGQWRRRSRLQLRHAERAVGNHRTARRAQCRRHRFQGPPDRRDVARGYLRRSREARHMNLRGAYAIYRFEMARTGRTLLQSIVSPVISTSLYFVVFGAAIGSRITQIDGIPYGSFIVPGLVMLMLLTQSICQRLVRHLFPEICRHDL